MSRRQRQMCIRDRYNDYSPIYLFGIFMFICSKIGLKLFLTDVSCQTYRLFRKCVAKDFQSNLKSRVHSM